MIKLPDDDGKLTAYQPNPAPRARVAGDGPPHSRVLIAAAHVVVDPSAANEPFGQPVLDWDATLAFRRHLWSEGLCVAEALDTAQRGMGLDWGTAAELIRRTGAEAKAVGGRLVAGVWTDHIDPATRSLDDIAAAYEQQLEVVDAAGAQAIVLSSRQLAAAATSVDDYASVYGRLLRQASKPMILHWVGAEWDPELAGYWGSGDPDTAMDNFLAIVTEHHDKVDGVKVAPLPFEREVELRRRLPKGVRCYTGDDFSYPQLMAGDGGTNSDALLGVLDPLAAIAADAVRKLDDGDAVGFRALLDPTVELSGHLFEGPGMNIRFYKTGFVFLAWLAGHQDHFRMIWGEQAARSVPHLAKAYRLADGLGLFPDPELAERRMRAVLATVGLD
ncbi:dihydrodipicolinate synthase family protein [Nocardia sp. NPDC050175]|uniref:dihydrodipicolinate synthase family protein n=1 Tax=Nocardia sp. NPDC050175 TaxID=3364317 RepID=UPI0037BB2040